MSWDGICVGEAVELGCSCADPIESSEFSSTLIPALLMIAAPIGAYAIYKKR